MEQKQVNGMAFAQDPQRPRPTAFEPL